jgi:hypothetical protein
LKQQLAEQLRKKDKALEKLKERPGDKDNWQDLERELQEQARLIEEKAAELAKLAADKELARFGASGDADALRKMAEAKIKEKQARDQPKSAQDQSEVLKKLTAVLQRWAEGKRAIEPAEIKKVLAELHPEPKRKKLEQLLDSKRKILEERDAELAKIKEKLAKSRAKPSPDKAPSKSGTESDPQRKQDAAMEKLKLLLKDQEEAIREKENELKKLQELLKKQLKGKAKNPDDGD